MIAEMIITVLAVVGLFTVRKFYAATMFLWTLTNGFWCVKNLFIRQNFQSIMFLAFMSSCLLCFLNALYKK